MGLKFDLAKSSLNHSVRRVVQALCDIASNVIKWPSGDNINAIKEKFARIAGLQNVIGAIDGTHVEIPAPSVNIVLYNFIYNQLFFIVIAKNLYLRQYILCIL